MDRSDLANRMKNCGINIFLYYIISYKKGFMYEF